MIRPKLLTLAALLIMMLTGCATAPQVTEPALKGFKPRSILVLPPMNNTHAVDASYAYLSTVTSPIAERGYYVFPVAVVDRLMRVNGLNEPAEMHQVSLQKLNEVFGADAVLYLQLNNWGSSYRIIESRTKVSITARLIDTRTGQEIWRHEASARESSADHDGGADSQRDLGDLLVSALFRQVAASIVDDSPGVARTANERLFGNDSGFGWGPYMPTDGR